MPQEKLGKYVTLSLDDDLDSPVYRTAVCEEESDGGISNSPTTTQTKCGTFAAPGIPEGTINISGVVNVDPDADELSARQLMDWGNQGTKLAVVYQDGADDNSTAGAAIYMAGQGYLSDVRVQAPANDVIKFTATLTFSGDIDTNPAS